jgi:hypothetical protein
VNEPKQDEPTQTTPGGLEIPVPEKADFLRHLEKLSEPDEEEPDEKP